MALDPDHVLLQVEAHLLSVLGQDSGRAGVSFLGAERIGHGIAAAQDPALMAYLAEHQIALEVCPTSNIRTRSVPSLEEHPLPVLAAAGVPFSISSDDPPMFATTVTTEYEVTRRLLDLDDAGERRGLAPRQFGQPHRAGVLGQGKQRVAEGRVARHREHRVAAAGRRRGRRQPRAAAAALASAGRSRPTVPSGVVRSKVTAPSRRATGAASTSRRYADGATPITRPNSRVMCAWSAYPVR